MIKPEAIRMVKAQAGTVHFAQNHIGMAAPPKYNCMHCLWGVWGRVKEENKRRV